MENNEQQEMVSSGPQSATRRPVRSRARRNSRRDFLRLGVAATGAMATALYVKPELKSIGIPRAFAMGTPKPPDGPPPPQDDCPPTINFETDAAGNSLAAGTFVAEQWAAYGIHISVHNAGKTRGQWRRAMIFDSAAPTGGDPDLGSPNETFNKFGLGPVAVVGGPPGPGRGAGGRWQGMSTPQPGENRLPQGKVLIISEDNNSNDPDDSVYGGTIRFTFDTQVGIAEVHLLDVDGNEPGGSVKTYDGSGSLIDQHNLFNYSDNSFQIVPVGDRGVRRMDINLPSSGAVTKVVFCP